MNELQIFNNDKLNAKVRAIQNNDGSISINAEDAAIGFGWHKTETKAGKQYHSVRWAIINRYCKDLGFDHKLKKDDFIELDLFFKLQYKSKCETRHLFVKFVCDSLGIENVIVEQQTRFECSFIEQLEQTLEPLNYELEKQKSMFNGKYRIDAYIEELKIAIEYDEKHHLTQFNKELDNARQSEIKKELECTFVRCDYRNTDSFNVGLVIREIFRKGMVA